jgi:DNA-binding response OmpR family regulator
MSSHKLLIVEDDADVRLGYQVLLRAHGYETCFAEDAALALSVARKEIPALIILDLGLPAGDGFVVLERLANVPALRTIPVIVVSARDHQKNEDRALKAGARAFIQKPWDDDALLALVRHLLGQPALSAVDPASPVGVAR